MKRLLPFLLIVLILGAIAALFLSRAAQQQPLTVYVGNTEKKPLPIEFGRYQDTQCGMPIQHLEDAAQAVAPDGKTWFFDDVGCLALWMSDKGFKEELVLWVYAKDTQTWIDAHAAFYTRTDDTPMHYGFGAYAHKAEGMIGFETLRLLMLRNEHLANPYTRRELLGER